LAYVKSSFSALESQFKVVEKLTSANTKFILMMNPSEKTSNVNFISNE
jgi:hypothetical protein